MIVLPVLDPSSCIPLGHALDRLGLPHLLAERPRDLRDTQGILLISCLPFEQACAGLRRSGWWRELPQMLSDGIPLVVLDGAMHLVAEGSEEAPRESGLGLLPGYAHRLGPGVKVPHLGWSPVRQCRVLGALPDPEGLWLQFQHSYALETDASACWEARHGRSFAVLSVRGKVMGCQARLPQSGAVGRLVLQRLLRAQGMISADSRG